MYKLGKRGAVKYPADISILDAYSYYLDKFKIDRKSKFLPDLKEQALSKKDFRKVAEDILQYKIDRILNHSECAKLNYGLGDIRIQKKKMLFKMSEQDKHYLKTDWGHFQKTGELKKHLNEHRNNHRYRFYWLCTKVKGKGIYKFTALREHNRKLNTILKNTTKDYFE